jgi:hypothetical protein
MSIRKRRVIHDRNDARSRLAVCGLDRGGQGRQREPSVDRATDGIRPTRRDQASKKTATQAKPPAVTTYVSSATQSRLGRWEGCRRFYSACSVTLVAVCCRREPSQHAAPYSSASRHRFGAKQRDA